MFLYIFTDCSTAVDNHSKNLLKILLDVFARAVKLHLPRLPGTLSSIMSGLICSTLAQILRRKSSKSKLFDLHIKIKPRF
jgi:hypothetical protein